MSNGSFENLTVTQKTELDGDTNTQKLNASEIHVGGNLSTLPLLHHRWDVAVTHQEESSVVQATRQTGREIMRRPPLPPETRWDAPISAPLALQPTGGNVGIGTLNPNAKLEVAGDIIATQFQWGNHSSIGGDQGGSIDLGGDPATPGTGTPYIDFHYRGKTEDYNTRIINDDDGQLSLVANTVNVSGRLKSLSPHGGGLYANSENYFVGGFSVGGIVEGMGFTTEGKWRLVVAKDGNVGIGRNNPTVGLEVVGHVAAAGADRESFTELWSDNAIIAHNSRPLRIGHASSLQAENWVEKMRITPEGNVGIGTTNPSSKLEVNGDVKVSGDIFLTNADCAEDFDIVDSEQQVVPGTVLVIDEGGALRPSHQAYDKCVAGVVSGAGNFRPGITLDKQAEASNRLPVALVGKVYCNVDSQYGSIEVGDLLTTSPTPGCAMKVSDPLKAFGAVIGKALRGWTEGQGLIPILVALQ